MQHMQHMQQTERPYRSHLRPACIPCRRRKSRCLTEAFADSCVTCRAHRTECIFPHSAETGQNDIQRRRRRRTTLADNAKGLGAADDAASRRRTDSTTRGNSSNAGFAQNGNPTREIVAADSLGFSANDDFGQSDVAGAETPEEDSMALGSSDEDHHNLHIVGPSVTNDSQVLSDYLSGIPAATRSTRLVIPESASRSHPVLFTKVQKRPLGIVANRGPSAEKLAIIEKMLEPHIGDLIDEYFKSVNSCLPLLHEQSFRQQFRQDKTRIAPALLACLYAHTLTYWQHSPLLSRHRCPDSRFIWNLANEATYSDLHLAPGMSIIEAILLNVGGRPTTSIIGNGVLLSAAVSMAHSLGLNHNPLPWKIPKSEKYLRMKIWWSLLLHDRWLSLAHGTPPLLSRSQYDVPLPTLEYLDCNIRTRSEKASSGVDEERILTAHVFIALMGLTDVLDHHLKHVFDVGGAISSNPGRAGYSDHPSHPWNTTNLELQLNKWVESLSGSCRLIVIRGTRLDIPGAANLRLAYLTTRLLLQRMDLEADKRNDSSRERIMNSYIEARRTAEDILLLLQELGPKQLGGFWLPVSAFAFPATVNFLLRCALETESSLEGLAQSGSFRIAKDIIGTLKCHQKDYDWDLADICLAQHAEIVDKVLAGVAPDVTGQLRASSGVRTSNNATDFNDFVMPDASVLDQYFPSLWDPLQNAW